MTNLSGHVWLALAAVGSWGLLTLLGLIAESIRNATGLHDLKVRVAHLRSERLARSAANRAVVVDEAPEQLQAAA